MLNEPTPQTRRKPAFEQGSLSQRQVCREFASRVSFAGAGQAWIRGCCAIWIETARKEHHQSVVSLDGRIVLAGENVSWKDCWRPGALLSSIDAITRLHQRALAA